MPHEALNPDVAPDRRAAAAALRSAAATPPDLSTRVPLSGGDRGAPGPPARGAHPRAATPRRARPRSRRARGARRLAGRRRSSRRALARRARLWRAGTAGTEARGTGSRRDGGAHRGGRLAPLRHAARAAGPRPGGTADDARRSGRAADCALLARTRADSGRGGGRRGFGGGPDAAARDRLRFRRLHPAGRGAEPAAYRTGAGTPA